MDALLLISSLILLITGARGEIENLFCGDMFFKYTYHSLTSVDRQIEGTCSESCFPTTQQHKVFGTVNYGLFSSICLSALHDFRISQNRNSSQKVSFRMIRTQKNITVPGSFRNGVTSTSYSALTYGFYFTSPRVEDDFYHMTSLHRGYLLESNRTHHQSCFLSRPGYKKNWVKNVAYFKRIYDDHQNDEESDDVIKNGRIIDRGTDLYSNVWSRSSGIGGFVCTIYGGYFWSSAISIVMLTKADYIPSTLTVVADIDEDVILSMRRNKRTTITNPIWFVNNRKLIIDNKVKHGLEISLKKVKMQDSGFYSLGLESRPNLRGIIRLIVRMCPKGRFGSTCQKTCPQCLNGGICHDLSGQCICPPGFKGQRCDTACGDDRIGQNCEMSCSSADPSDRRKTCKGFSICLPDPYGCSCGPGYKGIACDEDCDDGEYGAGCRQKRVCHCADGSTCDRFTGRCKNILCREGWTRAPFCDVELVYDITSLHRDYLLKSGSPHRQSCFAGTDAVSKPITFRKHPGNRMNPDRSSTTIYRPNSVNKDGGKLYEVRWKDDGFDGGFICSIDGSKLSAITSMTIYSNSEIRPRALTITANKGDDVTLSMNIKDGFQDYGRLAWHINQRNLVGYGTTVSLRDVTPEQTGIYSLNKWTNDQHIQGVLRLIVRNCEKLKYGVDCSQDCSICENGGICHGLTGQCICPPGFMGKTCQTACGEDRIGADCTASCSSSGSGNGTEGCRAILICLPDPYGCTCASGFKGLNCSEVCEPGRYGASCTQSRECHCAKQAACDPITGHCGHKKCSDGWTRRPYCDTVTPVLSRAPSIKEVTKSSITVTWIDWNPKNGDFGLGEVKSYIVRYKSDEVGEWKTFKEIPLSDDGTYELEITSMSPATHYDIKVLVRDMTGSIQVNSSVAHVTTECEDPLPQNVIAYEKKDGAVLVTWNTPPQQLWKCRNRNVNYLVSYYNEDNSSDAMFNTTSMEFGFATQPYVLWTIKVSSSFLRTTENNTVTIKYRSKQAAPGRVRNVIITSPTPKSIMVNWTEPKIPNGLITAYRIDWRQLRWRHECERALDYDVHYRNVTTKYALIDERIKPFSQYRIRIRARTIRLGDKLVEVVNTPEFVPSAPPGGVIFMPVEDNSTQVKLQWNKLPCHVTNGDITKYVISYQGEEEWSNENLTVETNVEDVVLTSLVPFTTYRIKVRASTRIGPSTVFSEVTTRTKPAEPPEPTHVTAYRRTDSSISITWKPPYPPNGELVSYKIKFNRRTYSKVLRQDTACKDSRRQMANLSCYLISDLTPKLNYTVQIRAKNRGVSNWSDWSRRITIETQESIPDPPEGIDEVQEQKNEASIRITWKEPFKTNGKILGYKVRVMRLEEEDQMHFVSADQNKTLLLIGLQPATFYNISISANTSRGFGPPAFYSTSTSAGAPVIRRRPEVIGTTDTTVTIQFSRCEPINGPIGNYYVVVFPMATIKDTRIENYVWNITTLSEENQLHYVTGSFEPEQVTDQMEFVVGDGRIIGGFRNLHLVKGHKYKILLLVTTVFNEKTRFSFAEVSQSPVTVGTNEDEDPSDMTVILVTVFCILLLLLMMTVVCLICRKKNLTLRVTENGLILRTFNTNTKSVSRDSLIRSTATLDAAESEMIGLKLPEVLPPPSCLPSNPIEIEDFAKYVTEKTKDGSLQAEFNKQNVNPIKSQEIAKLPKNRPKNRYKVMLPYDETRVSLAHLDIEDPCSDYINANYLSGYNRKRAYIATQGPMKNVFLDFWRMIWENNVRLVVMVTNLIEEGRGKCDQYWPDDGQQCGDVQVRFVGAKQHAEYIIRTFQVSRNNETRLVRQFHFTGWPDHSAPMYTTTLVALINEFNKFDCPDYGPVVVHCSAGIGRTGTVILLDAMMKMAKEEKKVDFLRFLCQMRQERVWMVQNEVQYLFAHNALLEVLYGEGTCICCDEFPEKYEKMKDDGGSLLKEQYQNLNKLTTSSTKSECRSGAAPENLGKNRCQNFLPLERCRPFLGSAIADGSKSAVQDGSSYINAVYVNGYKHKDAFILTQMPLPVTVNDFWTCVYDTECLTIVLLNEFPVNDETTPAYWSAEPEVYGRISVELVSTEEVTGDIIVRTFAICRSIKCSEMRPRPRPRTVKQFHLKGWRKDASAPRSYHMMIELIDQVDRWNHLSGQKPTIVQCFNGVTAGGLFCACKFICDKIKEEQKVDVFQAVRNIRANRPETIQSMEQYQFCYEFASAYLEGFQTYANFK